MAKTQMIVRSDEALKNKFQKVCKKEGVSMMSAVVRFMKQVVSGEVRV